MVSRKGIALWAAIHAGLLQEIEDTTKFEKFWELYDDQIRTRFEVRQYVSTTSLNEKGNQ